MSDDGCRPDSLPSAGAQNFAENGSETTENDQTGLPPWASALAAQLQTSFAAQMRQLRAENDRRAADDRETIRTLLEECRAGARDAHAAREKLQAQQDEFEALQERVRIEAAERSALTAVQAKAARRGASGLALDFDEGSGTPDAHALQAPPIPPGPPPFSFTRMTLLSARHIRSS